MRQYAPKVKVELTSRRDGSSGPIDITEWFGDNCSIRTSKGVMEPFGTFTITFLDKAIAATWSVYAVVQPMDLITIKAAHDGSKELVTLMRGFVSDIRRDESMGNDGKPARRVTLSGQDVGKIWATQYVYFQPNTDDLAYMITGFGILEKYMSTTARFVPGTAFVATMADLMNHNLAAMGNPDSMSITPAGDGDGVIPSTLLQACKDISYYQFMSSMLDAGAFYELWLDDTGDKIFLRWRYLWSGEAGETVTQDDIQSISVWRNDARVSNWFTVFPRGGGIISNNDIYLEALRVGAKSMDARSYKWCNEVLFGYRQLRIDMSLFPPEPTTNTDNIDEGQYKSGAMTYTEWIKNRTELLKETNKDNTNLESCTVRVRGNEYLRPGTKITVKKKDVDYVYYATKIEHDISLWQGFTSTIHGERGVKRSGDDVYQSEIDRKGVLA